MRERGRIPIRRRYWIVGGVVVVLVCALVVANFVGQPHRHRATTTQTRARPHPEPTPAPAVLASPIRLIDQFLGVYAQVYDGQQSPSRLPGVSGQVKAYVRRSGSLPARYRLGPMRAISKLNGLPTVGATSGQVGFELRNRRYRFAGGLTVSYQPETGWQITAVTAPDFDEAVQPAFKRPPVPIGLRQQALQFVRRYVGFLQFTGPIPFASTALQNTIATNQDPLTLAGMQPTGARLRAMRLSYGLEQQGQTIALTASIILTDGQSGGFSVLMRRIVGGWEAQSFLGPATSRTTGSAVTG